MAADTEADASEQRVPEADEAKWVILSYQLGIAVYLQSDAGISKGQAAAWFQNVEEADMEELDLGGIR